MAGSDPPKKAPTSVVFLVNIFGGLVFGYNIGVVGMYMQFVAISNDCDHMGTANLCKHGSVPLGTICYPQNVPNISDPVCMNPHVWAQREKSGFNRCIDAPTEDTCNSIKSGDRQLCSWDGTAKTPVCNLNDWWEPWKQGLFSVGMIIGAAVGSFLAGGAADYLGRKKTMMVAAVVTEIGQVITFIGYFADQYAVVALSRVLLGFGIGFVVVVCPLYVNDMSPSDKVGGAAGVAFQMAITLGIVASAAMGAILDPYTLEAAHLLQTISPTMKARFGILLAMALPWPVLLFGLAILIPEDYKWLMKKKMGVDSPAEKETEPLVNGHVDDKLPATLGEDEPKWPIKTLVAAFFLAVGCQLTGINAIMNYGPRIIASAGLTPFLGNLLLMIWNWLATLISIPLTQKVRRKYMFQVCLLVGSASCLFVGIPTFPGVASKTATNICAGIGIFVFIGAFEIGIGSLFFVLATEIFPPKTREFGCSFSNVVNWIFNGIINFFFPTAVAGLGGGNKGLATVFMIFGSIGLLTLAVLVFIQPDPQAKKKQDPVYEEVGP